MARKLIDIMSATADELAEIEGIDSGMVFTIVEIRTQNHFIDLHTVSRITGMRRKGAIYRANPSRCVEVHAP